MAATLNLETIKKEPILTLPYQGDERNLTISNSYLTAGRP